MMSSAEKGQLFEDLVYDILKDADLKPFRTR